MKGDEPDYRAIGDYTPMTKDDLSDLQKTIRPFVEAAKGALEFGNLTERSEFVLSVPSGAVRTRQRLLLDDLRELVRLSESISAEGSDTVVCPVCSLFFEPSLLSVHMSQYHNVTP